MSTANKQPNMRQFLANTLARAARWLSPKSGATTSRLPPFGGGDSSGQFLDRYRRLREPSAGELLSELKNTAWACASINAQVCADYPPRLFVKTTAGQAPPKCRTKALAPGHPLLVHHQGRAAVEEVLEHPLLTLLRNVNPVHNAFDLWELTQLYLETHGSAYWLLESGVFGVPEQIWILPAHLVTPRRAPGSQNLVDTYEYRGAAGLARYTPDEIICFRLPNPRDPYLSGLSPLRACFEQVTLASNYNAMRHAVYDNTGIPSVVISPDEVVGEEERLRLEEQWAQKFRKGGTGRALVAESKMDVKILSHSMGDLAALSEAKATKEDIANAFHIPIPYLSGDTNLANLQAADQFHMKVCIRPRLKRRDEKLNEQLIPLFDPSGRLFLASEDPTTESKTELRQQQELDLRLQVRSINEVRQERGLPPVPWGDTPIPAAGQPPPGPIT